MVIKWINEKAAWFFTNGNKNNSLPRLKERYGDYNLEEHDETVTVTMEKQKFIQLAKFSRYGLDCYRYNNIPTWKPHLGAAKSMSGFIDAINYDARTMSTRFYKEKNKKS